MEPMRRWSCVGEARADDRVGRGRVAEPGPGRERQVVQPGLGGDVEADDRDRRRQRVARARADEVDIEIGAAFERGRDDRDAGRRGDGGLGGRRESGLAEGLDAEVRPADGGRDGPVDRGTDARVRGEAGEEDRDAEGDPEGRQGGAQGAGPQAAPGESACSPCIAGPA